MRRTGVGTVRASCFALGIALLACCWRSTPSDRTLPQDAYVWQRVWTSALVDSVQRTAPLVAGFRVLVAEWSADRRISRAGVDWAALARAGRPVTAVLRIDVQGSLPSPRAVIAEIPSGHILAGVEIDFDCPTRRLRDYLDFLRALRPLLPPETRLSITVLPDWLRSPLLPALTAAADQSVLQVHATNDPRDGLFDQNRMLDAARRMSRLSRRPFVLSLPSYSVRVLLGPDGRPRATEAERSALLGEAGRELFVSPDRMARAVAALERDPPFRLAGLVWFRVPSPDDRRGWGVASWLAVLSRRPAVADPVLVRLPGTPTILRLENRSALDARLPDRLALDRRFHYRFQAAAEAERAASLLPPRSQAYAAVLCAGAQWLRNAGDGAGAVRFYRSYLARGALLPNGMVFAASCPDPDFDAAARSRWSAPFRRVGWSLRRHWHGLLHRLGV